MSTVNETLTLLENATVLVLPWYTLTLTGVSSGLSIIGCSVIFTSYCMLPEIRNFTRRLLLYLTVADMITAVGFFAGNLRYAAMHFDKSSNIAAESDWFCVTQSSLTTFSNNASYFWTAFMALHLWFSLRKGWDVSDKQHISTIFHSAAWGIPAFISMVAVATGALGEDNKDVGTGSWCFINGTMDEKSVTLWIVLGAVIWELLCYFTTCIVCVLLIWKLYRIRNRKQLTDIAPHLREEDRNFLFAGLVLYILKMWGTIRFLWLAIKPEAYNYPKEATALTVLQNFQSACAAAQGIANCVCFCLFDKTVMQKLKRKFYQKNNSFNVQSSQSPIYLTDSV